VTEPLKRTPLYDAHRALSARLVPFAGYEMPVQYEGVVKEHQAVRERAGLFDVSHMGELWLRGPDAMSVVSSLVSNAVIDLEVGRAKYTVACNERGTILDDLIIYRAGDEEVLVVCNASNRDKIAPHFEAAAAGRCDFADQSDDTALIALQGPRAVDVARDAGAPEAMLSLKPFSLTAAEIGGVRVIAARTGYTGEDGFELFSTNADAPRLWALLLEAGAKHGIAPAGLGARDTLRLEAALSLYGNDIDETTNPYEAGLGWVVKLDHDFLGREALERVKAEGPSRKLVGFEMTGRGIARHGYPIVDRAGATVGTVTSGSPGPTVGKNVGLGYVPTALAAPGTVLGVSIRDKVVDAVVVKTPFYKRR
jgi:aminomethyltransferase